jgi:hypothetical protein
MERALSSGKNAPALEQSQFAGESNLKQPPCFRWQLVVTNGLGRGQASPSTETLNRIDLAHPVFPPHLSLCWKREFGIHHHKANGLTDFSAENASLPRGLDSHKQPQRIGPARPKMLNPGPASHGKGASDAQPASLGTQETATDWEALPNLLGPLANDLRQPLSVAWQTLNNLAAKFRSGGPASLEDSQLLNSTASKLAILADWSDDILLSHQALLGEISFVRRRFRAMDWRDSLHNLLEGMARDQHAELQWVGWDDSLPNLYLDPSLITKAVYNLSACMLRSMAAGSSLRIRASRHSATSRHLLITLEAVQCSLPHTWIQLINGSGTDFSPSLTATALLNSKSIIAIHGGSLTAHRTPSGGCELRISLTVDSAESLVCSWLLRNLQLGVLAKKQLLSLHAAKLKRGDGEQANKLLQQSAGDRALVIRVSISRWLILELNSIPGPGTSQTIQSAIRSMKNRDLAEHFKAVSNREPTSPPHLLVTESQRTVVEGAPADWLEQKLFQKQIFFGASRQAEMATQSQLPQLLDEIAGRVQALMDQQPLIRDGFRSPSTQGMSQTAQGMSQTAAARAQGFGGMHLGISEHETSASKVAAGWASKATAVAPGEQVVNEIIHQWKMVQAKLAQFDSGLRNSHSR